MSRVALTFQRFTIVSRLVSRLARMPNETSDETSQGHLSVEQFLHSIRNNHKSVYLI